MQFQQDFHAASCLSCCTAANSERKAFARRSRSPRFTWQGFTQIRKAGLNRRTQRAQSFSLFPPFPPVRKIFICVNLRQSAGNSGNALIWCSVEPVARHSAHSADTTRIELRHYRNSGFGCGGPRWAIRGKNLRHPGRAELPLCPESWAAPQRHPTKQ